MSETKNPDEIELIELTPEGRFRFHCHPGLPCFTDCCGQTTIILSPYDILRLKRHLGLRSEEFLARYTRREAEERTTLPLVVLEMGREAGRRCPFLGEGGCTVYDDRPATCRYYPVAQGSLMGPEGLEECHVYFQEEHCCGFQAGPEWTLASWLENQGLAPYLQPNREFQTLLLGLADKHLSKITDKIRDLFYLAAYDLDRFRPVFLELPLMQLFSLTPEQFDNLRTDDEALLALALNYLKIILRIGRV
jgi:hypothetical protein